MPLQGPAQGGNIPTLTDIYMAYRFVRILTQPWTKTDAYKLGLIDAKGNYLKKLKNLQGKEKKAMTLFHVLVWNVKKQFNKFFITRAKSKNFYAALWLLREEFDRLNANKMIGEYILSDHYHQNILHESKKYSKTIPSRLYRLKTHLIEADDIYPKGDSVFIEYEHENPIGSIFGVPIYHAKHVASGRTITISPGDIR